MLKNLIGGLAGRLKKSEDAEADETAAVERELEAMENGRRDSAEEPVGELPPTLGFVTHQPVLDRQHRVVAYQFFVKSGQKQGTAKRQEFDRLMLNTMLNMEVFRLLAYRRAFVHVSISSLDEPMLQQMPLKSVIFVLEPDQNEPITSQTIQKLDDLKVKGLRFAIEPAAFDGSVLVERLQPELFNRVDFMLLDFAAPSTRVLAPILDQLPRRYPNARWMACNVGTAEDLDVCLRAPGSNRFALFHGPFLSMVRTLESGKVDTNQTRVLHIMRLLRANADPKEIEGQFKLDSVLLFKLLRFINSPVNGLSRKVQTIEETLMLLGRDTLFKWLSMLLFTAKKEDGSALALLEKSLIRARFLERLGSYRGNRVEAEHLFLTGMFSLLDVLLHLPFPDVLDALELPPTVRDAVIDNKGIFSPYLALAVACEQGDDARIGALCKVLNFEVDQANRYYLDSVVWAQEVLRESEVHNDVESV
ncbi:HDOD domain-containing protein [uncultured Aquitalea sp.]|uniref:EAL and HDOD domain-containing protein n=1 Tax=uncultured Aquitalea sp. TaxID=540272 RepID=UPI0025D8960F|nr:HDOD domain-containing protein [uncultured Aquitalea sp.]